MAGRGRDASMRSRIVCSSAATLAQHGAVARVVLRGQPVLAERRLELVLLLELLRALEMRARRRQHRALQRDLVVRVVGIGLHGPPVRGDGFVEIARAHRALALLERLPGRAAAGHERQRQKNPEPLSTVWSQHSLNQSAVGSRQSASRMQSAICNLQSAISRSSEPDRLPSAAVEIRHLNRFHADLQDPIPALDDVAFLPVERLPGRIDERRDASTAPAPRRCR